MTPEIDLSKLTVAEKDALILSLLASSWDDDFACPHDGSTGLYTALEAEASFGPAPTVGMGMTDDEGVFDADEWRGLRRASGSLSRDSAGATSAGTGRGRRGSRPVRHGSLRTGPGRARVG